MNIYRMAFAAVLVLASANIAQAGKHNNKPSKARELNAQIRALRSYRRLTPQQEEQLRALLAQKTGAQLHKGEQPDRYAGGATPHYRSIN